MTGKAERDEYGIDRAQAADLLWNYTRSVLGDRRAQLTEIRLESGRWQARLIGSRTGAQTVFLHQHGGRIVGGHTSAGPAAEAAPSPQGEASFRHQRPDLEAEGPAHFQTIKWHEPTRSRA